MSEYAISVTPFCCDLAHEVLVENLGAIVDDILDEGVESTLVVTCLFPESAIRHELGDYLGDKRVQVHRTRL